MGLLDSAGSAAVDKLNTVTIPELLAGIKPLIDLLNDKKKVVITLEVIDNVPNQTSSPKGLEEASSICT
jgi:hypothetical protein